MPRVRYLKRIRNAWGQPGVSSMFVEDAVVDEEPDPGAIPAAGPVEVEDGEPVVCIDTMMSETTLSIGGAREFVKSLEALIDRAEQRKKLSAYVKEHRGGA